jgi:hypothetical protein
MVSGATKAEVEVKMAEFVGRLIPQDAGMKSSAKKGGDNGLMSPT